MIDGEEFLSSKSWTDEWPGEFVGPEDFERYRRIHEPVRENPYTREERENRNTESHRSRQYGDRFEELLAEKHSEFNLALPETSVDRGYDALVYVLTDEGLEEKKIQVKGCFHSKKSNAGLNPRISIPYATHNGNGRDYIYHLGVYTFVDDIDDMEVLGETVLGYDAFDAMMRYVREEDPVGTNIQDSASRKDHALIEWDLAFRYAEKVHEMYEDEGLDAPAMEDLYEAVRETSEEYRERDERQISSVGHRPKPVKAVNHTV